MPIGYPKYVVVSEGKMYPLGVSGVKSVRIVMGIVEGGNCGYEPAEGR
jgi:hypothetical protein